MESILRQAGINSLDWDIENNILYLSQVSGLPKPAGAAELGKNVSIQVIEHFSETAKKLECGIWGAQGRFPSLYFPRISKQGQYGTQL